MDISTQRTGNALVISLDGELDAYWAAETERELWSQVDRGYYWLVLDLSALSYLSSGGLRALLRVHRRLADLGGKLFLASPQPYVRDVLAVSGLARSVPLCDTLQEALDALESVEPRLGELWSGALQYAAAHGTYEVRSCMGERHEPRVVGDVEDLLASRATPERLTTLTLSQLGYGLALGAPAESAAAAADRLGEMLTLPDSVFWLPGDGRLTPDFLTADVGGSQLSVHLLYGLCLSGEGQFYGRYRAAETEAGTTLEDWACGLLDWLLQQVAGAADVSGVGNPIGVVIRAELAEMWGAGLKRPPSPGRAPANGQEITHRENIADWLHYQTEPAFPNYALLAAGVLAQNAPPSGASDKWSAILGAPQRAALRPVRMHLHGAAFRPLPELGGGNLLRDEVRHVVGQGELAAVAHLLPTTRLRSALFGVWLL